MPPLSIMIKPASSLCNMRCAYCFYHDVAEARGDFSYGMMSGETAVGIIEKALDFAEGESVSFSFQGGEPLLAGLDFFRFFTRTLREKNKKNSPVFLGLQTNGLLLDRSWAAFFREEKFLVGLSLDGDFDANQYRVNGGGQNVSYSVLKAAEMLRREGADFNILTVLTAYCAEHCEEIYNFFKEKNFRYLQFIPCLRPFGCNSSEGNPLGDNESGLYMTSAQYAVFLIRLFRLYVNDYVRGNYISVRQFDNYVRLYLGERPEQCGMAGHCTFQYVIEGNGDVFPCDFYCVDKWRLGNINTQDFREFNESETARLFINESLRVPEKCEKCGYYPICRGGGCKRLKESGEYCDAYRAFFKSSLPLFRVFAGEEKPINKKEENSK